MGRRGRFRKEPLEVTCTVGGALGQRLPSCMLGGRPRRVGGVADIRVDVVRVVSPQCDSAQLKDLVAVAT